jgi:TonB family protein
MRLRIARTLLAACLGGLAAATAPASARDDGDDPAPPDRVVFDIPAQPLVSALDAYSNLTGRELFYDGALVQGRRSAAVTGALTPDVALRLLLRGTDFAWHATGPHSVTIALARRAASMAPPSAAAHPAGDYEPFFAALQLDLRQAFCRSPETWPARYQLLIRFWIAPSGAVIRSELLGSTGSRERDKAFAAALQRLRLAAPPPADMPQPVTMIVFPRSRPEAAECAASSIARGAD